MPRRAEAYFSILKEWRRPQALRQQPALPVTPRLDGITQKMLTQTLRALERDGLLTRSAYATIPPRVDYELTELGRSVRVLLEAIREWSEDHIDDILAARDAYDERAAQEPRPVA